MADNKTIDNGGLTDIPVATDEVTYSGDTADVQLVRVVTVTGSEGAKTVTDPKGGGTEADAVRVTLASDSTGVLSVDDNGGSLTVDGTVAVTGVATAANQTTELASLAAIESDADAIRVATQLLDDTVQVLGTDTYTEATSKAITLGAVRRDADTTLVNTTNEFGPLQMDANGRLKVESFSGETLPVSLATLPALVAGSANIGDVDVVSLPASTNTLEVVGDVAHDAGAAGNPVLNAGISQDSDDTAPPNRVNAEGDATRLATDRDGSLHVLPFGVQLWSYHDDDVAAVTTDGTVHSAPGAGLSLYVTDIIFSIGVATASSIFLEESTTKVLGPWYLDAVAGRGLHIKLSTPKKITANTALLITNTGATTFSVDVLGYTGQG
jgi:hypothetical protein